MSDKNDFLEKLAVLVETYDAELSYTTDDDGIHIYIGGNFMSGREIFSGTVDGAGGAKKLRAAKDK